MSKITSGLMSSNTDDWATPQYLFDRLNEEFHFDLDVCVSENNHKCAEYFTKEQDGLKQKWDGVIFCNPPYGSEVKEWVKKRCRVWRGRGDLRDVGRREN